MHRIFLFFVPLIFVFGACALPAQETSGPLVELKNQYSGKCLTVRAGSAAHGATLIHKDCETGGQNMAWEIRPQGSGYWIVNGQSGLCLGVAHQSKKDGEQVTQVGPCGRPDTLWKIEYMTPGPSGVEYGKPIVVRNTNSNKCLALVRGDEIKQYGCPPHRAKTTWEFAQANTDVPTAGRIPVKAGFAAPFYLDGKAYVFGSVHQGMGQDDKPIGYETHNAAFSWLMGKNPGLGFTPVMQGAKMSSRYSSVTSFTLDGHPYIFGLHKARTEDDTEDRSANVWRITDGGRGLDLTVKKGKMSSRYSSVTSFQLKGRPYIFGLHKGKTDHEGHMWSIDSTGGGKVAFNPVKYKRGAETQISPYYKHIKAFYIKGHPYIFGLHTGKNDGDHSANIWRIKDDPTEGFDIVMRGVSFPLQYDFILPFTMGDGSYLLAAASNPAKKLEGLPDVPRFFMKRAEIVYEIIKTGVDIVEEIRCTTEKGDGYVVIYKIEGDPMAPTIRRVTDRFPISDSYRTMTVFQQDGGTYLFGVHKEDYANIWRIGRVVKKAEDDPEMIVALVYYGRNK